MASVKIDIEVITAAAKAALKSLNKRAKEASKTFDKMKGGLVKVSKGFALFGAAIAGIALFAVTKAMSSFISGAIKVGRELETLTTQFEVLTGSAAEAEKTMKDLQEFSARTPFQVKDLAKSTAKLIGFGFTAEEAKSKLQALGDVASSSGSNIQEISLIFGQVSAAGKLTGERLLQLQERAIPIGPAIAKTMGIAESAVRDAVSKGKVDFATFEKAFESLNDKGQFAFDGMAKASRTLDGRISTLKDNFALLQNDFIQKLAPAFKAITSAVTTFIQRLRADGALERFAETIAKSVPKAISFTIKAMQFLNDAIGGVRKFIGFIEISINSFVSTLIGMAAKTVEISNTIKAFFGQEVDTSYAESLRDIEKGLDKTTTGLADKVNEIEKSTQQINALLSESGQFVIDTYEKEVAAISATAEATEVATKKKVTAIQTFATFQQNLEEARKVSEEERIAGEDILAQTANGSRLQTLIDGLGAEETARVAFQAKKLEDEGKHQEAVILLRKKSDEADKAIVKQKQARDKQAVSDRGKFLSRIATLQSSGNKTLFAIGKAAAIAQATIAGHRAISESYTFGTSVGGPPVGALFAGLAAAATAVQIANIASSKPPSFQHGGIVPGSSFSGDNVAANVNSGEMILNREQQANLFSLAQTGGGETTTNITVELDGEVVGRAVSRQVADGLVLGEVA